MGILHRVSIGLAAGRRICLAAVMIVAVPFVAGPLPGASQSAPAGAIRGAGRSSNNTSAPRSVDAEVRRVLEKQQSAWNRGYVDAFLFGYWNSDKTVFAGSQGILHGWQALRDRYHKNYPDLKAMGTLTFSDLEVTPLCKNSALVVGKWHLERSNPVGGVFSLVLRRLPEGWRIIADHTSVVAEPVRTPAR